MNIIIMIVTGIAFLIYGFLVRKTPVFIGFYNQEKYSREILIKVQRISSFITSITSFILAFLIYKELLQMELFLLTAIMWGISNMTLLRIYSKRIAI